ncbi:hypothetical protein Pelo_7084 [Pelomyxa schiedti]|nr:hypothetical protein Pelo_7084 [Pelomyxa schiedti]
MMATTAVAPNATQRRCAYHMAPGQKADLKQFEHNLRKQLLRVRLITGLRRAFAFLTLCGGVATTWTGIKHKYWVMSALIAVLLVCAFIFLHLYNTDTPESFGRRIDRVLKTMNLSFDINTGTIRVNMPRAQPNPTPTPISSSTPRVI